MRDTVFSILVVILLIAFFSVESYLLQGSLRDISMLTPVSGTESVDSRNQKSISSENDVTNISPFQRVSNIAKLHPFTTGISANVNSQSKVDSSEDDSDASDKNNATQEGVDDIAFEPVFSVIIVSYNEELLDKTILNVLQQTDPWLLKEVLVIDDNSTPPARSPTNDTRVRIINSPTRLGLIKARYTGGNEALGSMIAFIDAHVYVSPTWLNQPFRILSKEPNSLVNYLNFNLDAENYKPRGVWSGVGSTATIDMTLKQSWGGGSKDDDFSPITMGMFATSKQWWDQGAMDPDLKVWGGENVEISFRTWLCGGQIIVAKESYVAHGFRSKFPYHVSMGDVNRNYMRIANIWMDQHYLQKFYEASKFPYKAAPGVHPPIIGSISERMELKKKLNCKSFSFYAKKFEGRALCLPKRMQPEGYKCGGHQGISLQKLQKKSYKEIWG